MFNTKRIIFLISLLFMVSLTSGFLTGALLVGPALAN